MVATLLFDPSMSALPIIAKQNSPSVGLFIHPSMTEDELDELDSLVTLSHRPTRKTASGSKNPDDEVLKLEQRMKKLEEEEKELLKNQKLQQLRKAFTI